MKNKHINEIIELENDTIDVADIEAMIKDKNLLESFQKKYQNSLYLTIILSLTHKECKSEEEAKTVFENISTHHFKLNKLLKRDVGITVATLDYLTNISDTLVDPIIIEERKSEVLSEMATVDELTELYLRDVFDVILHKDISESKRTQHQLSLAMIDIDDFKKVNDTYGHQKADEVLKSIGQLLNKSIREMDTAARYGGEELVIIMPNTNIEQAYHIADRVRENISRLEFDGFSVTVSIGVSQTDETLNKVSSLVEAADKALYEAKNSGKNRVV